MECCIQRFSILPGVLNNKTEQIPKAKRKRSCARFLLGVLALAGPPEVPCDALVSSNMPRFRCSDHLCSGVLKPTSSVPLDISWLSKRFCHTFLGCSRRPSRSPLIERSFLSVLGSSLCLRSRSFLRPNRGNGEGTFGRQRGKPPRGTRHSSASACMQNESLVG